MDKNIDGSRHRDREALEFDRSLSQGVRDVREGCMTVQILLRLARTRDEYAVQYCLRRMADPNLDAWEEQLLARVLQRSEAVQELVSSLANLDPEYTEVLARVFRHADEGWQTKVPVHLHSPDVSMVLRLLDLLEKTEDCRGLLPLLFALLTLDAPQIQSKAALLIESLDRELAYTRRLLRHPIARVRANTVEALVQRNDSRARDYFRQCTTDPHHRVRVLAAVGLCRAGDPLGWEILTNMIQHPTPIERRSGVWGLGMCGSSQHLRLLDKLEQTDPDPRVRQLAANSRERISNHENDPDRR